MKFLQSPLFRAFLLLFSIFLLGALGFYLTSPDFSFFDAVYMTVITLSTVGFTELEGFTALGRRFAILYILLAFLVVTLSIRYIVEALLNQWSPNFIKKKKNKKMIKKLNQHTIVCGFGRNGRQAVSRLKHHKEPYVVIEHDPKIVEANEKQVLFQRGTALSDEILLEAGIKKAKNLICALPDDSDNLFVVLTARKLQPEIVIVSRVSEEYNQSKLKWAGADHVIMPDKIGGDYMASLLTVPYLIEFLGNLDWWNDETSPNVEEIELNKLLKKLQNKTLEELQIREKTGCNIIGYRDDKGKQYINPEARRELSANGKLIVLGTRENIKKLNRIFQLD